MGEFDVVTFGSAVVDVFVGTDLPERKNFIAYPAGAKIEIKELRFDVGGGGTNTAVAFARLGFKTGYIGKLGEDNYGHNILELLRAEKVEFLGTFDPKEKTGYSIILDSREHERTILTYKGINNNLDYKEIQKVKAGWLYLSSLQEKSFESQKRLAKEMKAAGTKIAYNPSEYQIKHDDLTELLKMVDVLVLNKEEAIMLAKTKKNYLQKLRYFTDGIVVVTDRDRLVEAYDGGRIFRIKPDDKIKVVERTGAGDAFASGFVAGRILGRSIEECLKLGLAESESVIGHYGAKNNLIKRNLKGHGKKEIFEL